jgi:hypothetical protein
MRKETIKQMQEQAGVARSAICRLQILARGEMEESMRTLSQAISDVDQELLNKLQDESNHWCTPIEDLQFLISQAPRNATDAELGKYLRELAMKDEPDYSSTTIEELESVFCLIKMELNKRGRRS